MKSKKTSLAPRRVSAYVVCGLPEPARKAVLAGRPTGYAVMSAVARVWGVRVDELRGASRKQHIVQARQMALTLCRRWACDSNTQTGQLMGRHHATVSHSARQFANDLATSRPYAERYQAVLKALKIEHREEI